MPVSLPAVGPSPVALGGSGLMKKQDASSGAMSHTLQAIGSMIGRVGRRRNCYQVDAAEVAELVEDQQVGHYCGHSPYSPIAAVPLPFGVARPNAMRTVAVAIGSVGCVPSVVQVAWSAEYSPMIECGASSRSRQNFIVVALNGTGVERTGPISSRFIPESRIVA